MKRQQTFLFLASVLAPLVAQAAPILTLSPASGSIQAGRGGVVGWGFTISNPDPNYLVVTSAEFCKTVVVAGFTVCDQLPSLSFGTFTDYIAQFNFILAGPGGPVVSQTFNQALLTGIGGFAIAAAAPFDSFSGQILLTYDLYSRSPNDPLFDAGADFIPPGASGHTLTASASVSAVPEPTTILLFTGALAVLVRHRRKLGQLVP